MKKLIDTTTREEIAKSLNCDTSLITKHYNGDRNITLDYAVKYAKYFDVSLDYLAGISNEKIALNDEWGILLRKIYEYTGLSSHAVEILETLKSFGYTNYCDLINRLIEDLQPELDSLRDDLAFPEKSLFTTLVQYMEAEFLNNNKELSISAGGNLIDFKNTKSDDLLTDYRDMFIIKEIKAGKIIEQVLRNSVIDSLKTFKQQNDMSWLFRPDESKTEISIDDIDTDDLPF
ncbi:MAG: helix-turn-helix transcriptional regulator [Eubacterium sp.]|nr:helix-turn-helix transcriptional regulator [Eubacterium sp.]